MPEPSNPAEVIELITNALRPFRLASPMQCVVSGLRSRQVLIRNNGDVLLSGPLWTINPPSRKLIEAHVVHQLTTASMAKEAMTEGIVLVLSACTEDAVSKLVGMLRYLHLEDRPVLLVGKNGLCWAHLPSHGIIGQTRRFENDDGHKQGILGHDRQIAWTTRQQWVARAIALYHVHHAGWSWPGGDRPTEYLTAKMLADVSGINLSSVSIAIRAMEDRGWLDKTHQRRIRIMDAFGMLHELLTYASVRPARMIPARILQAPRFADEMFSWLQRQPHNPNLRWALTGWHALQEHQKIISSGVSSKTVEIVTDREDIRIWRAVPCERHEANIIFRLGSQSDTMNCALPGATMPIVDPILATMHVAADLENGREQVAYLQELFAKDYRNQGGRL